MRARKLAAMLAAFSLAACSGGGGSNAGNSAYPTTPGGTTPSGGVATNTILAGNDAQFTPSTIVVQKGTTVNFVFADTVHTLYFGAATGKPDDLPASSNTTVTRTFNVQGTFTIYCRTHTYMIGFVSVQ